MALGLLHNRMVMEKVKIFVGWNGNYSAAPANEAIVCIVTGKSLEDVKQNMEESLRAHLDWMREDGDDIPSEFVGEYELEYELNGRALVHYAEGLVDRGALARLSGINRIQLGHYLTGRSTPRPQQVERIKNGIKAIAAQLTALSL